MYIEKYVKIANKKFKRETLVFKNYNKAKKFLMELLKTDKQSDTAIATEFLITQADKFLTYNKIREFHNYVIPTKMLDTDFKLESALYSPISIRDCFKKDKLKISEILNLYKYLEKFPEKLVSDDDKLNLLISLPRYKYELAAAFLPLPGGFCVLVSEWGHINE